MQRYLDTRSVRADVLEVRTRIALHDDGGVFETGKGIKILAWLLFC